MERQRQESDAGAAPGVAAQIHGCGSGSHSYGVVPVGPDALGGPTATKIGYHQTGGGALSGKTSVQLIAAGLTHIIPGVLTLDGGAGREANKLAITGLPVTIQPIVASPLTSIGIAVGGGAAEDKAIETVVSMLQLRWQPWQGEKGGIAGSPVGPGLALLPA